jgi:NAD-dependent dihydropyrimidine dehydrogenase PreA subunit
VVIINTDRCNGCGACLDACPTEAIYLVDDRATVDESLCRDCRACINTCPTEAISLALPSESVIDPVPVPALQPEPHVIQVKAEPAPATLRSSLLPVVGGALAWAGREILPRLADYFLYDLDRRLDRKQTCATRQSAPVSRFTAGGGGNGRRRRRRRHGR